MFDLGWSEILVIVIVAILVIGPKDLPKFVRVVADWLGKMRKMASHFQAGVDEMIRQSELDDLRKDLQTIRRETARPMFPHSGPVMTTTPAPSKMVATSEAEIDAGQPAPPAPLQSTAERTYIEPPPPPPAPEPPPVETAKGA